MRGSTKRRGDSWRARYRDDDGREHQRTFPTKRAADQWLREQLGALGTGTWVDPSAGSIPFADYAAQWLESQHVRPNTRRQIEIRLRLYLGPVIGTTPLRSVRRSHVVEIVRRCSTDLALSPLVVRHTVTTLRSVLDAAVADRLVTANVARDRTITMPRPERSTGTLDATQVAAIAERVGPRLRAMIILGAASGLRPGELAGLTIDRVIGLASLATDGRVSDLGAWRGTARPGTAWPGAAWLAGAGHGADPEEASVSPRGAASVVIRVDRQLVGSGFGPPKTPSSVRDVSIPPAVVEVLVEHVRTHGLGDGGLLFSSPTGRPMDSPRRSRAWARATAGMELAPGLTLHDLRHFHASTLLGAGVNIAAVSRRLGHASPAITLSTYAHVMPSDEERVLNASEAIARGIA